MGKPSLASGHKLYVPAKGNPPRQDRSTPRPILTPYSTSPSTSSSLSPFSSHPPSSVSATAKTAITNTAAFGQQARWVVIDALLSI
ncbi:hypothetical protein PGT21_035257 [Puccinia graminis f. sp. tritici]|uniref:Uncharacterized protein n=1 Tax=Puccinia graminis f. sp. tritici TaxID=56615 RepID=A0A5B0RMQ9_PUCGR|nr:hypothetical protein PGT21_035257 [Puccinia graminis f. sp. tritici]KAA1126355.1 hypothetical protein PGTUg99_028365 [Puccinia graminis f. sp. tritici]